MDTHRMDEQLREFCERNSPPFDEVAFEARLRRRTTARRKPAPAPRNRRALGVVGYASMAVLLVAAITVGSLEAFKHLGKDQPVVVITDDTAGMSPGSSTSTSDGEGFAVYLPAREVPVSQLPILSHIEIAEEPLLSSADIISYRADIHQVELTPAAYDRIVNLSVPMNGLAFVVCVDRNPIYAGAFWAPISSWSFDGVAILVPVASDRHVIQLQLGYPSPQFFSGEDPRADPAILQALERAGKLD